MRRGAGQCGRCQVPPSAASGPALLGIYPWQLRWPGSRRFRLCQVRVREAGAPGPGPGRRSCRSTIASRVLSLSASSSVSFLPSSALSSCGSVSSRPPLELSSPHLASSPRPPGVLGFLHPRPCSAQFLAHLRVPVMGPRLESSASSRFHQECVWKGRVCVRKSLFVQAASTQRAWSLISQRSGQLP